MAPDDLKRRWDTDDGTRRKALVVKHLLARDPAWPRDLDGFAGADEVGDAEDLRGVDFSGLDLAGLDLSHVRLDYALLDRCDLSGARLQAARLPHASLRSACLRSVDLLQADLRDAEFSGADLSGALLLAADCSGASFRDACLRAAAFDDANLDRADFAGANLELADLQYARGATAADNLSSYEQPAATRPRSLRQPFDGSRDATSPLRDQRASRPPKWVLTYAIHRGTFKSRDVGQSQNFDSEAAARQEFARMRRDYAAIGCQIWFAYLTSPDGIRELLESSRYR